MSSPASNTINIRLDIQIPTGVGQPNIGLAALGLGDNDLHVFYRFTEPANGDRWPVRPVSGTSLGVICAKVKYDDSKADVRAFVYPDSHYPPSPTGSHPFPTDAISGIPSSNNTLWIWTFPSPQVKGADHFTSTTSGASNRLGIWFRNPNTTTYTFDNSPRFDGFTDTRPCGGSPYGSAHSVGILMEELAAADILLVTVRGGPFHGDHPAKRTAGRTWTVDLGKDRWEISAEQPGRMVIRTGSKSAESKRIEANPFMAVFPAAVCGAKEDVLVSVP